jgi:hypothetical protein
MLVLRSAARALAIALLLAALCAPAALVQERESADLPPVSYTCVMHPDVVTDKKGSCPICKMDLVPVRLESIWTCPIHAVVHADKPGKCPIDHQRDLIQVTVALTWMCAGHPEIDQIDRGTCADGSWMLARYTPRPHGNHNPQHGGLFFMAPDNWHHLEGAYPRAGVFLMHLYDDYTKPLPLDKARQVVGRVVTKEIIDSAPRASREVAAFPLKLAANGQYLEAKIDAVPLPAQMIGKVTFVTGGPEYRFDFTFPSFSVDPNPTPTAVMTNATSTPNSSTPRADAGAPTAPTASVPNQALADLSAREKEVKATMDRGEFASMWVPALAAKDIALAIQASASPSSKKDLLAAAVKRVVVYAWLLDAYGDQGNAKQIAEVYREFSAAVSDVQSASSGLH